MYARADAIAFAEEALALCDDPRRRFEVLRVIVTAHTHHGDVDAWDRALCAFEAEAPAFGDAERFAALEAREHYLFQIGDREAQRRTIDAMRALARDASSDLWLATALDALGMLEIGVGDFRGAVAPLRDALAAARATGDRRLVTRVRAHLIQALTRMGEMADARIELDEQRSHCAGGSVEERLDLLWAESSLALATEDADVLHRVGSEMLALSTRFGDEDAQAKSHWMLAWAASVQHDTAAVERHYAFAALHFERLRQPQSLAATLINLGVYEFDAGRLDDAIEHFRRGAHLAEESGSRNLVAYALANTADAERLRGNVAAALASAVDAHATAVQTGEQRLICLCMQVLGSAECATGALPSGLARLREVVAMRREAGQRQSLADNLCALVEGLITARELDELAACAAELDGLAADEPTSLRTPTRVWAALAQAAHLRGDAATARAHEERGRASLTETLERCADDVERAAISALPFNQILLRPTPSSGRGTRTGRRSS
ncbi:MAG: hypothetical protein JO164_03820 [Candidatus Eremiobacteraeota bacterium]|nr:hypothetical protein [Candidatus Eremiobacteraeota bacterium]